MRPMRMLVALALGAIILLGSSDTHAYIKRGFKGNSGDNAQATAGQPAGMGDEKPFAELIKGKVVTPGLFTFYRDTADNSILMAIKPSQFGTVYLCGATISKSDGAFSDYGSMSETFPFYFKRVGKNIMMMEKNLRLRADTASVMSKALQGAQSDGLFASTKIKSGPDMSGEVLVDASAFFVRDAENMGFFVGQMGQTGVMFDQSNSYFGTIKSFPENSELDVVLHYKTQKPQSGTTLQNNYSFFWTYHFSLSTLPSTDYVPRIADDRVGYFLTQYQDYTGISKETPYVRYINRWNLKKKNPEARLSEPVEPIKYWVENTWPKEFRDAVAEGIEYWNKSFEKVGFRNAIVAEQMPDTATWDPADARYSTVRWIVVPGGGYAVGPSRANPFTGQIYDADIRVASDFIRYMFNNAENYIKPVSFDGSTPFDPDSLKKLRPRSLSPYFCDYGEASAIEGAFGLNYILSAVGELADKDSIAREYIHSYIVNLVAHEVGHTLGFRHNFKASMIYSADQINDRSFTTQHSNLGTCMDYAAPNVAGKGKPQGEFYNSVPGPYDDWVIEYGYSELGGKTAGEDLPKLAEIASRSADPALAYGTDEDALGGDANSVDPSCNYFDLGNDPIGFAEHKLRLTRELWTNGIKQFEKPGNRYTKLLSVFNYGWRAYAEAASWAPKYVGGIYTTRNHIGDANGTDPLRPTPASEQRRAMAFLRDNVFAADAFAVPAALLNKLAPERFPNFDWSNLFTGSIDYPFHQMVLSMQNSALAKLYHPATLGRLTNNLARVKAGDDKYTMYDMFTDARKAIWGELNGPANINSYRRQLQLAHLQRIITLYLSAPMIYPADARTLASNDLDVIEEAAGRASRSGAIDGMTQAHLKEVLRQIAAAKKAQRSYSQF
ncbi:MAG: zinc-dependent metalloprotease [candidate division Zixibacteria bacterium]|nr:zinc-dependent metalloprotease [candidate division Zixibacteria bacterium]